MDGLRKVPDNVPKQDMLAEYLGKPLTQIPDPFETHESFAHHNNAMLRRFLDRYSFDYEFLSATDCYTSGRFDEVIRKVLLGWDAIMGVMLPTLGEERRKTYSPVLPISAASGKVLQVPIEVLDPETGMVAFEDEGERGRGPFDVGQDRPYAGRQRHPLCNRRPRAITRRLEKDRVAPQNGSGARTKLDHRLDVRFVQGLRCRQA